MEATEIEGDKYVKVRFPVDPSTGVSGEGMWVKLVSGDDCAGRGVLNNEPFFTSVAKLGDTVEFTGGTDKLHPNFVRRLEPPDVPAP